MDQKLQAHHTSSNGCNSMNDWIGTSGLGHSASQQNSESLLWDFACEHIHEFTRTDVAEVRIERCNKVFGHFEAKSQQRRLQQSAPL
jgi:hypothetical protein